VLTVLVLTVLALTSHVSLARTCPGRIGLGLTAAIKIGGPDWIAQALIVPALNLALIFQERIAVIRASTAMSLVVTRRGRLSRASIALPIVPISTAAEAPEQRLQVHSPAHNPIGSPIAPAPNCPVVLRARGRKMLQGARVNSIEALDVFPTVAADRRSIANLASIANPAPIANPVSIGSPASTGSQGRIDPVRLPA
jgi:hypothetical protein